MALMIERRNVMTVLAVRTRLTLGCSLQLALTERKTPRRRPTYSGIGGDDTEDIGMSLINTSQARGAVRLTWQRRRDELT